MAVWQHLVKRLVELMPLALAASCLSKVFCCFEKCGKVGLLLFAFGLSWPLIMSGGVHFFYFQVSDETFCATAIE